ncbi:MAG: protein translocase subunit SecD [Candidatus Latescibacteria bacterium]|nr:protein translocase subunit SecD [Candidatus Latescibacterota bacterium]
MRHGKLKAGIIIVLLALGIYTLYPTFVLYNQIPKERRALEEMRAKALTRDDSMRVALRQNELSEKEAGLHKRALHLGLDLVGGMHMVLEVDKAKLSKEEARDATDRALAVIQNRIDQFGVYEPIIQKVGQDRILVQLPGVDRDRAKGLIGQVALLEFRLVADEQKTQDVLKAIDDYYRRVNREDTLVREQGDFMHYLITINRTDIGVEEADYAEFNRLLSFASDVVPQDHEFLFGLPEVEQNRRVRKLYLLKKEAELTGASITDASPSPYQGSDPNLVNTWIVSLKLSRRDATKFAAITGRNVNKRLAIVLDNVVRFAPVIRERIPTGEAMITTGEYNPDRARDLSIILRSGALPAPVVISEERSVGPALGKDSIDKGVRAGLFGALIIAVFLIIYYSATGFIANIALFLNVFFIMVVLAGLKATLTLPGIAGVALTIGMAVDANILIFERIREELKLGKKVRAAIDAGYSRASVTIFDANVTTILTTVALYFLGTGPIRGFAITLIVGLIINVITSVYISRWIFEWAVTQFPQERLRI